MVAITLIYVIKKVNAKAITNEVGGHADVAYVVKQSSAKVIQFTPAVEAEELELAAL